MHKVISFLLAVAIAVSPAIAAAPPPIKVDTRVKIALRLPAEFRIRITTEPHAANRTVCLYWGIYDFYESGCFNAGVKTEWRWLKLRESGEWTVYATVERTDGTIHRSVPITLMVRGPGYEEPTDPFGSP